MNIRTLKRKIRETVEGRSPRMDVGGETDAGLALRLEEFGPRRFEGWERICITVKKPDDSGSDTLVLSGVEETSMKDQAELRRTFDDLTPEKVADWVKWFGENMPTEDSL